MKNHPAICLVIAIACCYSVVGAAFGALPSIVLDNLKLDGSALGVAMGCYAFTVIPSRTIGGLLMRVMGYRFFLCIAAILLSLSTIGTALASNYYTLIGFRLLVGVGVGFMMAVGTAWMVEIPARTSLGSKLGSVGTVNYVVLSIFAPLSAFFSHYIGARLALLSFASTPFVTLLISHYIATVPVDKTSRAKKISFTNMMSVAFMPGIALMLSGIGYASIISFGIELGELKGLTWPSLLIFVFASTMVLCRLTITQYASHIATNSYLSALIFITEAIGLFLLSISNYLWEIILGSMLVGFAMSLIFPLLGVIVTKRSTCDMRGTNLAFFGSFINLGIGLGSVLLGIWIGGHSIFSAFGFGAFIALLGAVAIIFVRRTGGDSADNSAPSDAIN